MTRVRAGSVYAYDPALLDLIDPPAGASAGRLKSGDLVRVVNLPGCPRANTMRMCHIEHPKTREFLGLVCVGSLRKGDP